MQENLFIQKETILLKIKVEQGSKKSVSKTLEKAYVDDQKYNAYFWTYTSDSPALGEVRGKIVIVQNFKVN